MRWVLVIAFAAAAVAGYVSQAPRPDGTEAPAGSHANSAEARPGAGAGSDGTGAEEAASEGGSHIRWGSAIQWHDWESGLARATAEGKPLCLVVYAEWCARCRELAPVFEQPGVVARARDVVMVRQDQDEQPAWLRARFGETGNYVPRVLFLDPQGTLLPEIQSGHPRYPYFYSHHVADRLVSNLRTAAGG